jgi:hypothetical protein
MAGCVAVGAALALLGGCQRRPNWSLALEIAVSKNDTAAVKAYLSGGGDPDVALEPSPDYWFTPLHLAAQEGPP